ncbi:unnamed protein product [Polarella glacialis]|uniref:Uncharacterized protein n=1 Tax=Polarella glacialis TaxID=89957 RepID=A0A813KEY2_POLGL|nr:unnamed protein product [Polarella glacialis]CAE8705268.1 unnamed protein product [Polarella glacialis]
MEQLKVILWVCFYANSLPTKVAFKHERIRVKHRLVGRKVDKETLFVASIHRGSKPVLAPLTVPLAFLAQKKVALCIIVGSHLPCSSEIALVQWQACRMNLSCRLRKNQDRVGSGTGGEKEDVGGR